MAITNATILADWTSGIGTEGAVLQVDNTNNRLGIGTTNPQAMLQVGTAVTVYGNSGIVSATSFYGDGSNLSNVISGVELKSDGNSVGTAITQINFSGFGSVTAPVSGFSTVSVDRFLTIGARTGSAVTFSIADSSFIVENRSGGDVTINL